MKLVLTQKYVGELIDQHCHTHQENVNYLYGITRIFFNYVPLKGRLLMLAENQITVLHVNNATLMPKDTVHFSASDIEKMKVKKGLSCFTVIIYPKQGARIKTVIPKAALTNFGPIYKESYTKFQGFKELNQL